MKKVLNYLVLTGFIVLIMGGCDLMSEDSESWSMQFVETFQYGNLPTSSFTSSSHVYSSNVNQAEPDLYGQNNKTFTYLGYIDGQSNRILYFYNIASFIPRNATIESVYFKVHVSNVSSSDDLTELPYQIFGLNDQWSASYTTWNSHLSLIDSSKIYSSGVLTKDEVNEDKILDFILNPAYVQQWLQQGGNHGFILTAGESGNDENFLTFYDNGSANAAMRPSLIIYYSL